MRIWDKNTGNAKEVGGSCNWAKVNVNEAWINKKGLKKKRKKKRKKKKKDLGQILKHRYHMNGKARTIQLHSLAFSLARARLLPLGLTCRILLSFCDAVFGHFAFIAIFKIFAICFGREMPANYKSDN